MMATHSPLPLETMLSAIPSLPRAYLSRLVDRMIDRMDEIAGDADLGEEPDREAEEDRCEAGGAFSCVAPLSKTEQEWRVDGVNERETALANSVGD